MSEEIKLIRSLEAVPKEWKKFQTIEVEITFDDGDRLITEWDELEYKTQDLKEILREIPQPTKIIKGSTYYLSILDDIIHLERNKSLGRLSEAQSHIAKLEGKLKKIQEMERLDDGNVPIIESEREKLLWRSAFNAGVEDCQQIASEVGEE